MAYRINPLPTKKKMNKSYKYMKNKNKTKDYCNKISSQMSILLSEELREHPS